MGGSKVVSTPRAGEDRGGLDGDVAATEPPARGGNASLGVACSLPGMSAPINRLPGGGMPAALKRWPPSTSTLCHQADGREPSSKVPAVHQQVAVNPVEPLGSRGFFAPIRVAQSNRQTLKPQARPIRHSAEMRAIDQRFFGTQ